MKIDTLKILLEAFEGCPADLHLNENMHPECGNTNPINADDCNQCWVKSLTEIIERRSNHE